MNIVKIYKGEDTIPTFIIESQDIIDSTNYISWLGECKEEIYIDDQLIDTIYHTI